MPYFVRNDNVAEPDELLTISIARGVTSASIPVDFMIQAVNVTIIDDDSKCMGVTDQLPYRKCVV